MFEIVVEVFNVTKLNSVSYRIQFNPTGFKIADVLSGTIDGTVAPVEAWNLVSNSNLAITQPLPGLNTVSGDGELATIKVATSSVANVTNTFILVNSSVMGDNREELIQTVWEGTAVRIIDRQVT